MQYLSGRGFLPKLKKLKLLSLGLSAVLVAGTLTVAYANSRDTSVPATGSAGTNKHTASSKSPKKSSLKKRKTSAPISSTVKKVIPSTTVPPTVGLRSALCNTSSPKHPNLSNASSAELRKLAQYETACNGGLAERSSFFVSTPTTPAEATKAASDTAAKLKEYASFGIKPLIFMEPSTDNGGNLDLEQYKTGLYDPALDAYFAALRTNGVTDAMMGMWVFIPEGNLPVWSSIDPNTYATDVTKTIQFQKKYFPNSQAGLLLDSESYASIGSWGNGTYVSLLPYVQNIPKGLVDSFGLQGFPWASPANQTNNSVYDPLSYLRTDLAAEAARSLGVSNIWFNTGSFNKMYSQNAAQTVTMAPAQRQIMLDSVVAQAKTLKAQGFSVDIHLFAQNKASYSEATDWAYWQDQPGNDPNTTVFTTFVHDSAAAGIPLWLFDSTD